ncbi:hypothetical protein AN642_01435 [Epulopiscium sp. SCG-B10WGA-EpuloA2]|nr:hypothetical protein AN642_01435 [Epulopiscium sp. SCG-B10WGA-EpuloA2]
MKKIIKKALALAIVLQISASHSPAQTIEQITGIKNSSQVALTNGKLATIINDIMQYRTTINSNHSMYQNYLTELNKQATKQINKQDAINILEQTLYIDIEEAGDNSIATEGYINELISTHVALVTNESISNQSLTGNVIVNAPNVVLKDMTIDGDVIIAQGVEDGEITFENVILNGKIVAHTECRNHINLLNSSISNGIDIGKYAYDLTISGARILKVELNTEITVYGAGTVTTDLHLKHGLTGELKVNGVSNTSNTAKISKAGTKFSLELDGYTSMSTGHHISHVEPLTLETGRGVAGASKNGIIVTYDNNGNFIWQAQAGQAIINGLEVADIDGDGFDEVLAASTDGRLYAFDHDGTALWTYETGADEYSRGVLYAVACAKLSNGEIGIFFGGVSKELYQVDKNGTLVKSVPLALKSDGKKVKDEIIITLDVGIREDGSEYIVMITSPTGNYVNSVSIVDPNNIDVEAMHTTKSPSNNYIGRQDTVDIDFDGVNDILYNYESSINQMGNYWVAPIDYEALTNKYDSSKVYMAEYDADQQVGRGYRMGALSFVDGTTLGKTQADSFIVNLDATRICKYTTDGKLLDVYLSKFAYNDGIYDPETGLFYLASEQSGGDTIRIIDMKNDNWSNIFKSIEAEGLLLEVIDNLVETNKQIDDFVAPSYKDLTKDNYISVTNELEPYENKEKEEKIAPHGNVSFATYE